MIAAMEANHPHLTTQKTLYVEISRARDPAELVTDDKAALREQLEAVNGERIAALEAVEPDRAKGREAGLDAGRSVGREEGDAPTQERERSSEPAMEQVRAPKSLDSRSRAVGPRDAAAVLPWSWNPPAVWSAYIQHCRHDGRHSKAISGFEAETPPKMFRNDDATNTPSCLAVTRSPLAPSHSCWTLRATAR